MSSGGDGRAPLPRTQSIKKSAGFVKVEGFSEPSHGEKVERERSNSSPRFIPARGLPRVPSLLTRQLSHENIAMGGGSLAESPGDVGLSEAKFGSSVDDSSLSPSVEPKPLPRYASIRVPRRSTPADILKACQDRYPVFQETLAIKAFHIAYYAHDASAGQMNDISTGSVAENPFARNVHAASILAELGADEVAVAGVLLHDVLDRTMLVESQLRHMLRNEDVILLVKGVSHLGYVAQKYRSSINGGASVSVVADEASELSEETNGAAMQLLNLMVSNGSPRSLLIRLAVALQDARWLDYRGGIASTPPAAAAAREARRLRSAAEALDVWAPLANRLGVWSLKAELEDRAFRALHPAEYHELRDRLEAAQEPTQLIGLMNRLRAHMQESQIDYLDMSGRPKHLWGVWQKMQNKGYVAAERVHDVRGLRVIVKTREDCYRVLRAVETAFRVVGTPKNYIKTPKPNGYQSLHVIADPGDGHLVEIQIRTDKMHYMAEYGAAAAHWKYKEGTRSSEEASSGGLNGANWAKYEVSQTFLKDKKVRPSGSPTEDNSLTSILAAMDGALASGGRGPKEREEKIDPSALRPSSPDGEETASRCSKGATSSQASEEDDALLASVSASSKGKSFEEYITSSGQRPVPPNELATFLLAVVVNGTFSVVELENGSTLKSLIFRIRELDRHRVGTQPLAILNRQEESDFDTVLHAGDMVELYPSELSPRPRKSTSEEREMSVCSVPDVESTRSNLMPIGFSLSKRFSESLEIRH